jgi:hypothetical protein
LATLLNKFMREARSHGVSCSIDDVLECQTEHATSLRARLYESFSQGFSKISMKSFIDLYRPPSENCSPNGDLLKDHAHHVQIALYIQGLRYHNSKGRKDVSISLTQPVQFLHAVAAESRRLVYEERVRERLKEMRAESLRLQGLGRLQFHRSQQEMFMVQHAGLPKLFTFGEVDDLNAHRPPDDQLELDPSSMLLRHHCCFLDCDKYLVNLSTEKDRLLKQRRGIFKHFRYMMWPAPRYVKGLHTIGRQVHKRSVLTFFVLFVLSLSL